MSTLIGKAAAQPGYQVTVDLESRTVYDSDGFSASFEVDEFRRYCLLNGLDDIALTLQEEERIAAFETAHTATLGTRKG